MADKIIAELKKSEAFNKGIPPRKVPHFYKHVFGNILVDGLWLDFCIGKTSATTQHVIAASDKEKTVHGFDWFRGLPEDWVASDTEMYRAGAFQAANSPESIESLVNILEDKYSNLHVVCGLIEDSLPVFLKKHSGDCALVHIDCDLYSTTSTILTLLVPRIVSGTVIVFDEFWNYPNYKDGEYKAFMEFIELTGHRYEFVAHVANKRQAALRIL